MACPTVKHCLPINRNQPSSAWASYGCRGTLYNLEHPAIGLFHSNLRSVLIWHAPCTKYGRPSNAMLSGWTGWPRNRRIRFLKSSTKGSGWNWRCASRSPNHTNVCMSFSGSMTFGTSLSGRASFWPYSRMKNVLIEAFTCCWRNLRSSRCQLAHVFLAPNGNRKDDDKLSLNHRRVVSKYGKTKIRKSPCPACLRYYN